MSEHKNIEMRDAEGNVIILNTQSDDSYIITNTSSIVNVKGWC